MAKNGIYPWDLRTATRSESQVAEWYLKTCLSKEQLKLSYPLTTAVHF